MARNCANQGLLGEALQWCEKAIIADKMNASHHYFSAIILQEQGQHDIAIQSLVRALYLDPDLVLAHFSLGNLHRSQGRYREAQRYFGNVLLLLRKRSRDEILPDAEELTAGRLIDIVTSLLAGFPHSAAIRGKGIDKGIRGMQP
jgi:chemotaxis protein methyltransferase CheR